MKNIFFFLFLFFSVNSYSNTNPFVIDYATVRTPVEIFGVNGDIDRLMSKPYSGGGATLEGSQAFKLGKASASIPLLKNFTPANIAKTAAGAVMNKTAFGFLAALALPYTIDAITGAITKQVPFTPVSPSQIWQPTCCSVNFPSADAACKYYQPTYHAGNQLTPSIWECLNSAGQQVAGVLFVSQTCTAPSYFDSATSMCVGSAINEPANAAQLESDIAATFGSNPAAAPLVLDELLDKDQVPTSEPTKVGDTMPTPIPGKTETTTKEYFDPATGHPVVEETTKQTSYEFKKTGDKQVDVTPKTTATTTITDTVTNNTTTNIVNTSTTIPESDGAEQTPSKTDCDKYPNSIGCSEYGTAQPENIQTSVLPLPTFNTGNNTASCPSPVSIHLPMYGNVEFPWTTVCQYAAMLRNVGIATALLGAAFFVLSALVVA